MIRKLFLAILAIMPLVHCGGGEDLEAVYAAENEGAAAVPAAYAIDSNYADGTISDPAFTGSDVGSTSEAWVSDLYHGLGGNVQDNLGVPCYSSSSTAGTECVFPQFKQVNITFQGQGAACLQHRDYILSHGGTQNEYAQIILGIETGFNSLTGVGSGVVIKENNTAGTNMTIAGACYHTGADLGIFTDFYSHTRIVDLPSVGGVNPGNAVNTIAAQSSLSWSPENIWAYVTAPVSQGGCGMVTVTNPQRIQLLRNMATQDGIHEALHMLGFSHFKGGLMNRFIGCTPDLNIPSGFGQALSDFSGGSGGPTIKTGSINPTSVP